MYNIRYRILTPHIPLAIILVLVTYEKDGMEMPLPPFTALWSLRLLRNIALEILKHYVA